MMRYRLPIDRLVNCLVPHYLSGRRFILWMQSLVWPLQTLNDRFCDWARERRIEAAMTSQVLYFEWYLNRRFGRWLCDPSQRISISEGASAGVDLYHENAQYGRPFTVWFEGEAPAGTDEEQPRRMFLQAEERAQQQASFTVCVPAVTIPDEQFVHMIAHEVERYRLAGRTYLVRIESKATNQERQ